MPDFPALRQLMGAYFHQDWELDGDESDVVDLFVRHEPESADRLPAEVDRLLAELPDEPALRSFILEDLGAYYLADAEGGTFRGWLSQIAERVRAATP
jgi:hypothetical protein